MAVHYKTHLASELVSAQKTVSYRTLARSLKVHVNAAKCMLYEFYEDQRKRKPGSIYATYLLSGTKKDAPASQAGPVTNGKDHPEVPPPSSPPIPSSSMVDPSQQERVPSAEVEIKVKTITLVREENLEGRRTHLPLWLN
jgi:DNA polymerase delta subunit 3